MKTLALTLILVTTVTWASPQRQTKASSPISAKGASSVALLCKMKRLTDGGELEVSVVLKETEKIVRINDEVFSNVEFDPYRINGSKTSPNVLIPGISRKASFALDRVTGSLVWMTIPVANDGGGFTEAQKLELSTTPLDPAFIGSCVPSQVKF